MRKFIYLVLGLITGFAGYIFLRINVSNSDIGGPVGTFVAPRMSTEEMVRLVNSFRFSGVFWLSVSIILIVKVFKE